MPSILLEPRIKDERGTQSVPARLTVWCEMGRIIDGGPQGKTWARVGVG